jgi:hypothetical protein
MNNEKFPPSAPQAPETAIEVAPLSGTVVSAAEVAIDIELYKREILPLTDKLAEKVGGFTFSGLTEESIAAIQAGEEYNPPGMPSVVELMALCEEKGIQFVAGTDPASGNAFFVPTGCDPDDHDYFSLRPKHLKITDDMDPDLIRFVRFYQFYAEYAAAKKKNK